MRSTFVIIVCIGILSIFIFMTRNTDYVDEFNEDEIEKRAHSFKSKAQNTHMNDQPNHLFWFVQVSVFQNAINAFPNETYENLLHMFTIQISDIHISIFRDEQRIRDFRQFSTETLDTIKPSVVIASGDLTDARGKDLFVSQQYDDEWKIYNEILTKANIRNKTIWLDLRGNHG